MKPDAFAESTLIQEDKQEDRSDHRQGKPHPLESAIGQTLRSKEKIRIEKSLRQSRAESQN